MELNNTTPSTRQKTAVAQGGPISIPGFSASATPPPATNELVRVEQAIPVGTPPDRASRSKE